MTDEIFNKGFKTLLRFLKDEGMYNQFKMITVSYFKRKEIKYKKHIKKQFDATNNTWWDFFSYTRYVGEDYRNYNDPRLNNIREKWRKLIVNTDLQ